MKTATAIAVTVATVALVAGSAQAQTIPHTSHHLSFNAPQMRTHGSGFHRPNRLPYHHQYGHAGYRPVHPVREADRGTFEPEG